ncbi:glycosyltransferase family 9 protein [Synechococcus sp. CBW1107]|uniref:glycosyltransferase family 9 protein n=1 Tax=Synechococcus sp. CBW1107 TaxID=2789857 RepID=UPI002AD53577|nr:glycosyltransferase family 9 protein [Synechococcus sp. CBW1107]
MAESEPLLACLRRAAAFERRHAWIAAAAAYGEALALEPGDGRLWGNLGHALWLADLPQAAETAYRQALACSAPAPAALCGLANALRDLNRFEEALPLYEAAGDAEARWGLSQVLIGLERHAEAFAAAEARCALPGWSPFRPAPFWGAGGEGELDADQPLWIWSEQGFGDTLQYLRWIPALARRTGPLHLVVEANLVRLLQEGLAWMAAPPRVVSKDTLTFQPLAAHGPLMSLPHRLGPDHAPAEGGLCLRSPLWSTAGPSLLPEGLPEGPRVGLVWASGRKREDPFTHREYVKRSLTPLALWQLIAGLQGAGAAVIPLQYGHDGELAAALGFRLPAPRLDLGDFAHLARVVAQLDLVITVDTALAHLAGAMGAPGWILLPWSADPRWLRQREDSPWYGSLRLFRQSATGDWASAIEGLLGAFTGWSAAAAAHRSSD